MTPEELETGFAALAPWIAGFKIGERWYGGDFRPPNDWERVLFGRWPKVETILELGCCEGQHTQHLAAQAKRVLALDARQKSLERVKFTMQAMGHSHVEFAHGNLETMELSGLGRFDVCYCVGLLYHLVNPWHLIERLPAVTDRVMLWTHYCLDVEVSVEPIPGVPGRYAIEGESSCALSGMSSRSFYPTLGGLRTLFERAGYTWELWASGPHPNGPALMAFAEKSP